MSQLVAILVWLTATCASTIAQPESPAPAEAPSPIPVAARSDVFRCQRQDSVDALRPRVVPVREMVDALVMSVTGQGSVGAAWASLVKPTDVVGIKVCTNGAPLFSTHPEVTSAICEGLVQAGLPPQNLVVFDRDEEGLKVAGYRTRGGGYRLLWTEGNYDPQAVISSPITGKLIYGDLFFVGRRTPKLKAELGIADKRGGDDDFSNESHLSRIMTKVVTKVVNVPTFSDHFSCGLSGALYNMTVQNVDNWRRLVQDPAKGDPDIPETYANPQIGPKVVITIMDGLIAMYAGAPIGDLNYAVQYGTLLASRDPVAVDSIALRQIDLWRRQAKMNPASKDAKYVQSASSYGLGNADPGRIDLHDVR